jgi:hypothetical protein
MTNPRIDPSPTPGAARGARPILVEIATAFLIVSGAFNLLLSIQVLLNLGNRGEEIGLLTLVTIGLAVATIGLGLLARSGRAWLVTVNVVAVLAFLELTSATLVGLLFGVIDLLIVLVLIRERPWFQPASPADAEGG